MDANEHAKRLAGALSTAMNALSLVETARHGQAVSGEMLRQHLTEALAQLRWLETAKTEVVGLAWPPDAKEKINRLAGELERSDPNLPPSDTLLDTAAQCLAFARGATG